MGVFFSKNPGTENRVVKSGKDMTNEHLLRPTGRGVRSKQVQATILDLRVQEQLELRISLSGDSMVGRLCVSRDFCLGGRRSRCWAMFEFKL